MAQDLNRVQLLGYVGAEPELRYLGTGVARATFSVATNRRWKNAAGEAQDATEWTRIVAWDHLGEIAGQYVHTGARVYLEGRLQTRAWDDGQTGVRRTATEVVADELLLLDAGGRPGVTNAIDDTVPDTLHIDHASGRAALREQPPPGERTPQPGTVRLRVKPRARLLVPASQVVEKERPAEDR